MIKKEITAILEKNGQHELVKADQFRSRIEPIDVDVEEELKNEEHDLWFQPGVEESDNEPQKKTDKENESRTPIRGYQERHEEKQYLC